MIQIDHYYHAANLDDAYQLLTSVPGSVVLGGGGYIRLGSRTIAAAIDLSRLDLDYVHNVDGNMEIGAMTTLHTLETHPLLTGRWQGVMSRAVESIVGVQLRNLVTIGGTVAGRYPFSDPLTALLALDARLYFHHQGEVTLADYLAGPAIRDILVKIAIGDSWRQAAFASIRRTRTDYAVLNTAVARTDDSYRIVVGARPGRAMLVPEAAEYLHQNGLDQQTARAAGRIAAQQLRFGDNPRGSGEYRRRLCPVLVARALMEVSDAA
jgi:CO/xanthine dehydrogenase FAD-binding subunit